MVGLAVVQVLLGRPFDAVLTTLVMFLGIALNVGQQLWARGRLKTLELTTRTQATVVRGGVVRSIDPGQVVRGDVLVVGPGDQILADGQVLGTGAGTGGRVIVVDESMLTGDRDNTPGGLPSRCTPAASASPVMVPTRRKR